MTKKWNKEKIRKANPVRLSNVLNILVKDMGIGPDLHFEKIKSSWQEIVGITNARNTRPVSLKNGILTIVVSSPAWITQAQFYKSSFMNNIREFEPQDDVEISDIRFRLERY